MCIQHGYHRHRSDAATTHVGFSADNGFVPCAHHGQDRGHSHRPQSLAIRLFWAPEGYEQDSSRAGINHAG